jgi:hypothetical protein
VNWLKAIIHGILAAIFDWGQKQAEKPKTTADANTPKDIRDELNGALDSWLRDQKRGRD